MTFHPQLGQVWEEVDTRRAKPRKFVIAEFFFDCGLDYVGCVRFFGMQNEALAPNPKTGRKPRRFRLRLNEFAGKKFCFTGAVVSVPLPAGNYPPTKSYGL